MDDLFDAIRKFGLVAIEYEVIQHGLLEAAAKDFLKKAKAAMGTYEYGWPQLQADTISRKTTGDTPLIETGEMKESGSYEIHTDFVLVGFEDPKMHFHEFGTPHVPPRPVIGGTIDHHGQEIADDIGIHFGEIFSETLAGSSIASAITRILRRI